MKPTSIPTKVATAFKTFPPKERALLMELRELILQTAESDEQIGNVEETLKWGQPSYLTPNGSTVRLGISGKHPGHVAVFFTCSTRLVATFQMVYPGAFEYEGNRALLLPLEGPIPTGPVAACITAALNYQKVKDLPALGI